jgi:glycerol-3-phosphate acyltransferase PlsX
MPDVEILLVGDQARIEPLVERIAPTAERIGFFHCTEVVAMDEKAARSLRSKPDSSMKRCAELVAEGRAQAMVSAGNTGAQVAVSSLIMGLIPTVSRPGIAVNFPGRHGSVTTVDVGANIYCRPQHLFEYGIMGSVYQRYVEGKENPRVGLLSIGSERSKGTELVKETIALFEASNLNFVGNVEGNAMLTGVCDVLACDGFAGNIMLKTSEGVCEMLLERILHSIDDLRLADRPAVAAVIRKALSAYDYSAYGGAPLFGIKGVSIICHGRSNALAITNAIRAGADFARHKVIQHITEELERNKALLDPAGLEN